MLDLISLGECLVELYCDGSFSSATQFYKAYGGDTLNTAVAAARLGSRAGFISRFGDDPFAPFLRDELQRAGIDLACCPTVPGFNGLYLISLGDRAERESVYYKAASAASTLKPDDLDADYIRNARLLHASGISQSISPSCRSAVRHAFEIARAGGVRTSYDPNFRPKLWSSQEARLALEEILPLTDIFLTSAPEETNALIQTREPGDTYSWARERGAQVVAIKEGPAGCLVAVEGELRRVKRPPTTKVGDTPGAGDAFNGGFLYGLLQGYDPVSAAMLGVTTAGLKVKGREAVHSPPGRNAVEEIRRERADSPPREERPISPDQLLSAYIDGGSRGNPGPAGTGVHLDLEGSSWRGLYQYLGRQTNNVAEYSALLYALEYALKKGFRRLAVYSDSELLVRQILGQYRVKNENLQPLHQQATEMIRRLDQFTIQHVPRSRNEKADRLANKALDLRESGEEYY